MPYGKPNLLTQLPPRTPSVLIRTARWGALITGVVYAYFRKGYLKQYYEDKMIAEQELREFIIARQTRYFEMRDLESKMDTYKMVFGHEKPFNQEDEDRIQAERQKGIDERKAKRDEFYSRVGDDRIQEAKARMAGSK